MNTLNELRRVLAAESGIGDNITMYSASFALTGGLQDYDLQKVVSSSAPTNIWDGLVQNKKIAIHRVYYKSPAAMWRFFGYMGIGGQVLMVISVLMECGPMILTFELVPAWQNKLQAMQYETDLYTRAKSLFL